jgi:microcystin-dependent protein
LYIPDNPDWLSLINGALIMLIRAENYEQINGISAESAAQTALAMFLAYQSSDCECEPISTMILGHVFAYITASPPVGCLQCDGAIYLKSDYPALSAELDSAFVVDATTFKVPDLRGRTVVGAGAGTGLTARAVSAAGGAENHQLSIPEIPAHNHVVTAKYKVLGGTGRYALFDAYSYGNFPITSESTGGGGSHNNMQPFTALKYAIVAIP